MILYFDTETTGLYPGRIIQLAYILDDGENAVGKNFYFAVDYIEPSATAVHGITVEKLRVLSGGKTFSDHQDEIFDDFLNADLIVAHNAKFDIGFMIAEFKYLDRVFRYNGEFDTMKFFTPIMKLPRHTTAAYKYPKLSELTEFAEVYSYDVSVATNKIFGGLSLGYHEAVFDVTAMYLAVQKLKPRYPQLVERLSMKTSADGDEN
ncbi:MAG: 3'-5' exonuclease [Clostridia bacterium]|nr:3'-5' exonuclease [Clostridia bacterium]